MFEAPKAHWLARLAESSIAWCLVLSFGIHVLTMMVYLGLRQVARSRPQTLPQWVREAILPAPPEPLPQAELVRAPEPLLEPEPQVVFVEVDPQSVTEEAPEKTPFYSTANTLAANVRPPETVSDKPKFEGKQDKMVRTFDNDVPKPFAPAVPPEPAVSEIQVPQAVPPIASQPLGGAPVGEVAFAKPVPMAQVPKPQPAIKPVPQTQPQTPRPPDPKAREEAKAVAKPVRPRTLAEARANRGILVGEMMKQDGGVSRLSITPSLDVRASPFGLYDAAMIYVIQQAWYALLDESRFTYDRSGKVVLRFTLRSDGSITNMKTIETEVSDTLAFICETAVIKPQPFARWPAEMRREVGSDTREITFTFHYF